jgi:hypothetical protein
MKKQLSEIELLKLQIQAYEFYAGLIDRAVGTSAHDSHLPRWDEQRAVEYRQLAEQLRKRLAELEAQQAASGNEPATVPVPTTEPEQTPAEPETAAVSDSGTTK